MAANAMLIAQFLLIRFNLISPQKYTLLYSIGDASYLLLMPLLYLYIRSLCYHDFRLKTIHLLHALPYIFITFFSLSLNFHAGGTVPSELQTLWQVKYWSHKIMLHVQIFTYLLASAVVLSAYRRRLKDLYSSLEKIDLAWCNLLLIGFSTMWFLDLLHWILHVTTGAPENALQRMLLCSLLINMVFTLAITYKGLLQSASFSGIQAPLRYATSRLKPTECQAIVQKLTDYMQREKPYLTPSLSMEYLSTNLDLPVKQLSQAIRTALNQNFYDLINRYRIDEAKQRICDQQFRNRSILALAFDVGYNSKSVFNAAFKKWTGMTPREYKNNYSS